MNKNLGTAVTTLGLFAGTLLIDAQSAGGAAGGGGAAAGGAAGSAGSASSTGAGAGTAGVSGTSGRASGTGAGAAAAGRVAPGGLNTVGSAGIAQPAGAPLAGGASTIEAAPNNIGGAQNTGGILANPSGTPGAAGTLPSGVQPPTAAQINALPTGVRSALQRFTTSGGTLNSITPMDGRPGTVRAVVTQNGTPMELVIGPNGQVLSRAPAPANAFAGNLGNTQGGLPLTSLPANLQNSIQSQLRGAQVQSITRDDLANGSAIRVTALQNGVPTEFRFAANGTLLAATPLSGAAAAAVVPTGALVPGSAVVMGDLPDTIQESIRAQLGDAEASRIMQQRSPTGVNYVVSYDQNGRPMTMIVAPDGRILRNGPTSVGATAVAAQGAGTSTNETEATTTTAMRLDDLPDDVESVLKKKAPYAEVRTITREQRVGGDVYVIAVRDGDRTGEITIDAEGRIVSDTRQDLAALTPPPPPADDKPQGMPYDELPVAIKNAIKAYTSAGEIRSITLGLDGDGRTVWDVIFYRDGRRDRMIVTKDGTLVRIEEDVSPALEIDSQKRPVIAIGDLPVKVRDTIRRQTDTVLVKDIKLQEVGDQTVYQVKYTSTNGEPVELLVSTEGRVVLPKGAPWRDTPADRTTATVDENEPSPAKTVVPSEGNARERAAAISASGTAATAQSATESGVASPVGASASVSNSATVKLSEVPEPVQNTVQKMAGSGTVQAISPTLGTSGVNYEVTFLENGKTRTVTLDPEGVVQKKEQNSQP